MKGCMFKTFDDRLKQVSVEHTLESYRGLLQSPVPKDAAEDILPGVLRRYDVPDLERSLGSRLHRAVSSKR